MNIGFYNPTPLKTAWKAFINALKDFMLYKYHKDHNVVIIGSMSNNHRSGIIVPQTKFFLLSLLVVIGLFFAFSAIYDQMPPVKTTTVVKTVFVKEVKEAPAKEEKAKETPVKEKKRSDKLEQGDAIELGKGAKEAVKKGVEPSNTLSNLAPILNPTYIKKHKISDEVVEDKMEVSRDYVKTYSAAAIQEMNLYGIPASITLAQGLLESNAGASLLARKANNHFGIKCFSKTCGKGHCMNATDDTHKDFFRIYPSGMKSYRAHSEFLQSDRYKALKKLGKRDYKGWAKGLKKAGYATAPHYAESLITIVEGLKLYQYDK